MDNGVLAMMKKKTRRKCNGRKVFQANNVGQLSIPQVGDEWDVFLSHIKYFKMNLRPNVRHERICL